MRTHVCRQTKSLFYTQYFIKTNEQHINRIHGTHARAFHLLVQQLPAVEVVHRPRPLRLLRHHHPLLLTLARPAPPLCLSQRATARLPAPPLNLLQPRHLHLRRPAAAAASAGRRGAERPVPGPRIPLEEAVNSSHARARKGQRLRSPRRPAPGGRHRGVRIVVEAESFGRRRGQRWCVLLVVVLVWVLLLVLVGVPVRVLLLLRRLLAVAAKALLVAGITPAPTRVEVHVRRQPGAGGETA